MFKPEFVDNPATLTIRLGALSLGAGVQSTTMGSGRDRFAPDHDRDLVPRDDPVA
ncbi:hypothetical protein GCM10010924_52190 [Rhizobium wenxiniae]|nr:hypothetical protein GCM10010924_52190 [Rhizobium wenxiniae]